ncbi:helix-turn-helix domain-containing protein [uncultured Microbacterium sp.]|uniref:winged helix-turn-helix domain-containing protein n=1 Tax=uncultured Microbacterium sp. TaxID=191216 RepID=UPI0025E2423E|nr:helix-turn-helix domain-containing protein [uncultured Microbacterium sp.]
MTDQPKPRNERVLDAGALRALAHPLRVRLYDILSQYGPQTASSLAELTGESTGATSYHLRALAHHDLIREVAGRGTARERWWERPAGMVTLSNPDMENTPSGRAVLEAVHSETLTLRHQQLMQFATHGWDETEEWRDAALIATASARLTATQTRELVQRIQAVIDETVARYRDQSGEGVRPITMRADIFPLPTERGSA